MELALEPATGTGGLELFSSPALIVELERTLRYSKFESRIKKFNIHVIELVTYYQAIVQLVTPSSVPKVVVRDADDDHVIAAAVAARAELIVTGDRKHLLPLGSHQRIAIVEPVTALMRLMAA
jgi:putative PIN family toxin of toxin-antitoxin system